MTRHVPICIVGAGPGGLYAALRLAQLGLPSLVLERETFPRSKACGDILTSNVLRALHALSPSLVDDLLRQPWILELQATSFGSARKPGFVMPFNSPANQRLGLPSCLSARRSDFDAWLYAHAAAHPNIEILQGCGVTGIESHRDGWHLRTAQGEIQAQYLILASGANSPLAKSLFPKQAADPQHAAVGLRMYYQDAAPPKQTKLSEYYLFDRKFMPGGLYITPFADGSVNVNAVMRLDTYQKARPKLADLMRGYLQAHPHLQGRFVEAVPEGAAEGSSLYFATTRRPLRQGNCLLIGDIAGLTDATNANGIGHAMISGGIAAEHIGGAILAGGALTNYEAAIYHRLKNALRPGKVMKAMFAHPWTAGLSTSLLNISLDRINSKAVEEFVYSSNTALTLLNPRFYWKLFAKR